MSLISFSVVISVYNNDNEIYFRQALESLLNQTLIPDEILIGVDGQINNQLKNIIDLFELNPIIKIFWNEKNEGLGSIRHKLILSSKNEIITVQDSDDIAISTRFSKQIREFESSSIDIVGGYIEEFKTNPGDLNRIRRVPEKHVDILKRSKWISPMNHVTIMFKKSAYLKSGGYSKISKIEDFDLFHRMIKNNSIFANIPEILVNVRFSEDQLFRRQGTQYLKEELTLFKQMRQDRSINIFQYFINISTRFLLRLLPPGILKYIYYTFLR